MIRNLLAILAILLVPTRAFCLPAALEGLAHHYGIQIEAADQPLSVPTHFGNITSEATRSWDVDAYSPLLVDEFGLYPTGLVQASRLNTIVLCRHLAFAGQFRHGVSDFAHHVLYLEADPGDHRTSIYQRLVIHHEFFHMLDNELGTLYRDPDWAALNPSTFHYGVGGANVQRSLSEPARGPLEYHGGGFISQYAQSAIEEDKAETFSYLMVLYGKTMLRIRHDEVLASKVRTLKARLEKLVPEMDREWWSDLSSTPIIISPRR